MEKYTIQYRDFSRLAKQAMAYLFKMGSAQMVKCISVCKRIYRVRNSRLSIQVPGTANEKCKIMCKR